ncbi:MAG: hypothetical protein RRY07_10475 [Bacteroidaceae bacterium]
MRSILFILGKYYPKSSANGICCKNIVEECKQQGFDITCVINSDVTRPQHEEINGVEVYRIKPRLYYRILDWCEYNEGSTFFNPLRVVANTLNKIQLAIMSPFWPFVSPLYTFRFYRQAKKLLNARHYDVIISAYTPIDSVLAGHLLKKEFPDIKYVPYYLDALAGGWGPMKWSKAKIEKRTRYWEKKFNSNADVVVSMMSAKHYHEIHPMDGNYRRLFLDVPTFVESKVNVSNKKKQNLVALYAGSINYPQRNPVPLLDAFASFCEAYNIELRLIGSCNCKNLLDEYSEKTKGKIKYLGSMAHTETLQEEAEADFLINFGVSNPYTIPCKIFEYMQLRKPIISSASIENEAAIEYLEKYGSSFIFDERADTTTTHKQLLQYILSNPTVGDADYSRVFYKNTPAAFCDIIKSL